MNRFYQLLLIVSFLGLCWLGMQAVHELGHVLAAWMSGGEVERVVLHPLTFSRTDLIPSKNPHPLLVVMGGPLFGVIFPLILCGIVKLAPTKAKECSRSVDYLFRFFAGFCLVVNGAYIAFGPSTGHIDSAELLRDGAARWMLVLFGLITIPAGLYLWHGLGPRFGLGESKGQVNHATAVVCLVLLMIVVAVEIFCSFPHFSQ